MSKNNFLTLFTGSHNVHIKYANSLNSEIFNIKNRVKKDQFLPFKLLNLFTTSLSIPTSYKTIFTENCYYYPALKKKFGLLNAKIINMNVGPLFYNILTGLLNGTSQKILLSLVNEVDGFLVQGKFGKTMMSNLNIQKPSKIILKNLNLR